VVSDIEGISLTDRKTRGWNGELLNMLETGVLHSKEQNWQRSLRNYSGVPKRTKKRPHPADDRTLSGSHTLLPWLAFAESFRSSATVFRISRESASSDTARANDIAPTSALKVKIALDLAVRLSLAGCKAAIN